MVKPLVVGTFSFSKKSVSVDASLEANWLEIAAAGQSPRASIAVWRSSRRSFEKLKRVVQDWIVDVLRQLKAGQSVRNAAKITGRSVSTVQRVKLALAA